MCFASLFFQCLLSNVLLVEAATPFLNQGQSML